MNIDTERLANVSWLQVPTRQVAAARSALFSMQDWLARSDSPAINVLQPVPILDWPQDLFEDENIDL